MPQFYQEFLGKNFLLREAEYRHAIAESIKHSNDAVRADEVRQRKEERKERITQHTAKNRQQALPKLVPRRTGQQLQTLTQQLQRLDASLGRWAAACDATKGPHALLFQAQCNPPPPLCCVSAALMHAVLLRMPQCSGVDDHCCWSTSKQH